MRIIARLVGIALLLGTVMGCPNQGKGPDLSGLADLKRNTEANKDAAKDASKETGEAREVFFCFWNVENLFDDIEDGRTKRGDEVYDPYFARNVEVRQTKYAHLAQVLAKMNGGKGPDILCLAEVESPRACELLRDAINSLLPEKSLHYGTIIFEEVGGGRDIGVPLITRLPVVSKRGRLLGRRLRIMETRVVVNGHELVVIASHWSSRISDRTGATRAKYGDQIRGRFRAMFKADPRIDLLVCGDFNDDPDEPSVTDHLKAVGDIEAVRRGSEPLLFNPMARLHQEGGGTLYYKKFHLFDQICLSPGLLDNEGWTADASSAAIVPEMADRRGAPNRFGGRSDKRAYSRRGASDHFPVTIKLRVAK